MNNIMGLFLHIHKKFFHISARIWWDWTILKLSQKEISDCSSGGISGWITSTVGSGAMDTLPEKKLLNKEEWHWK